jgi:hypothetical protein
MAPLSPLIPGNADSGEGPSGVGRRSLMSLVARKWAPACPVFDDSDDGDE